MSRAGWFLLATSLVLGCGRPTNAPLPPPIDPVAVDAAQQEIQRQEAIYQNARARLMRDSTSEDPSIDPVTGEPRPSE